VVSVGDMVDRGPDSEAVWRFFRERDDATAILGNHEQKCWRWNSGELKPALSQRITRVQHGESAWNEACDWFHGLPRYLELPDCTVVHGFWQPGRAVTEQHPSVITGTMSGQKRVGGLGRPWYELYDGPKPLVVGHAIYDGENPLVYKDRVFGVDTGCVHGMRLTGLVVPDFKLVSVPARKNWWTEVRRQHPELRFADVEPSKLEWRDAEDTLERLRDDPRGADKARELEGILAAAGVAEARLLAEVEAQHQRAAATAGQDPQAYGRAVRHSSIRDLLHRRRTEGFGPAELRVKWSRPAKLVRFVAANLGP
jgi:serine/threonine protein phosphatase 1